MPTPGEESVTTEAPTIETASEPVTSQTIVDEFALVEIMGHRSHAGRVLEVEKFGAKMLRIDVPTDGDFAKGFVSHFYSGSAIFGLKMTDLATVIEHNKPTPPYGAFRTSSTANRLTFDTDERGDGTMDNDEDPEF